MATDDNRQVLMCMDWGRRARGAALVKYMIKHQCEHCRQDIAIDRKNLKRIIQERKQGIAWDIWCADCVLHDHLTLAHLPKAKAMLHGREFEPPEWMKSQIRQTINTLRKN